MTTWDERSSEERSLLNPSFCANLLWHAARGYGGRGDTRLSFVESFLVIPIVLHRETRESLPRTTATSLQVWMRQHPIARNMIGIRAQALVPFTKEALIFGGVHGFIKIENGKLEPVASSSAAVNRVLSVSSDEVRLCAKRASFIGKWFASSGSAATILALLGVRP